MGRDWVFSVICPRMCLREWLMAASGNFAEGVGGSTQGVMGVGCDGWLIWLVGAIAICREGMLVLGNRSA